MTQINHRACPVCESDRKDPIETIKFKLFDKHPMKDGYELVSCGDCGFLFADTPVTQADLDIYYKDLSKYEDKTIGTGGGFTKHDLERLVATAEFIDKEIPDKNARILDLGCANGGQLRELKNLGYTNLVGVDPSEACVEITKREVGCDVFQYSLFDLDESIGTFDVIILSHVLEHLLELRDTLTLLRKLLSPGGKVYAECPDANSYRRIVHAPFQEFNTEHINHFDELSFENLFGLFDFKKCKTAIKTAHIASDQEYFAVLGLFEKSEEPLNYKIKYDDQLLNSIRDYIRQSEKMYTAIIERLNAIDESKDIALFGIGQFSFKLLTSDYFKNRKNSMLFDSNALNQGKSIDGMTIYPSSELAARYKAKPFTLVITSLIHEAAIRRAINEMLKDVDAEPEIVGFQSII